MQIPSILRYNWSCHPATFAIAISILLLSSGTGIPKPNPGSVAHVKNACVSGLENGITPTGIGHLPSPASAQLALVSPGRAVPSTKRGVKTSSNTIAPTTSRTPKSSRLIGASIAQRIRRSSQNVSASPTSQTEKPTTPDLTDGQRLTLKRFASAPFAVERADAALPATTRPLTSLLSMTSSAAPVSIAITASRTRTFTPTTTSRSRVAARTNRQISFSPVLAVTGQREPSSRETSSLQRSNA